MAALVQQESGGKHNAVSPVGARGYVQFMPPTRREMLEKTGLDAWSKNPEEAVEVAAIYLKAQVKRFDGDLAKGLAAYNWGGGNVNKAINAAVKSGRSWMAALPAETRNYVPKILNGAGITQEDLDASWEYQQSDSHTPEQDALQDKKRRLMLKKLGMTDEEIEKIEPKDILSTLFFAIILSLFTQKSVTMEVESTIAQPAAEKSAPQSPTPPPPASADSVSQSPPQSSSSITATVGSKEGGSAVTTAVVAGAITTQKEEPKPQRFEVVSVTQGGPPLPVSASINGKLAALGTAPFGKKPPFILS